MTRPPAAAPQTPPPRPGRCAHDVLPNLITHVATTDATVHDSEMTIPVGAALAAKSVPPARLYLDSGYASPEHMLTAGRQYGIILVTPPLSDPSRQGPRESRGPGQQECAAG